ncbi:phage tail tape measure protein [Sphingomonas paucimobilis]|uniref:phage tail tape measure protein n=1 Tax=Sphingomonas paucimobilis TaxID=13689 RepID=UPI00203A39C7|nr:phage tail tape measure protein [Sphingomonas paucimobilis]MCM3680266.1 phage tail tape measure protein [Sphingomonas paucimobilis]
MNMAVVGAARVVFGADTSEFDAGAKGVEGVLGRLVEKFHDVEQRIKNIGVGVTLGVTVPFAAMVRAVDKGAGSFQAQMKKVEAALGNVTGEELKALSDQARTLGPAVGKGATEAAEAIEALGLAGVSTSDILGGALKAALDLSAAGMVDAASSSSLVTDIMSQFKVTAAQLPGVVQNVVGALDSSKFGFDDFRLAVGQGGAVAASAGVGFLDFATAISATSTQFTSGADAGTSFKTYIQSLTGNSKQAKAAMEKLGISFFDVRTGQMKPLAEQAQILRDALGNLTDKSKTDALKTIFGSDASRTAIGLMEQGREGFEKLQATVAGGDVEAKIQKRMEGAEAAGKRIAVAWESVKIAIGLDTGLLDITTAIKNGFARMLEAIANAPPAIKQIGAAFAALGAIMGPLMMVLGHVGAILLANFAASKFGLIGRVLALIISPVSTLITMLGEFGLARVLMMVGSRLLGLAGPVGWAISAILLFKDSIVAALKIVWDSLVATLGPPIEAIMTKLQALFGKLSGGPIGAAVEGLISILMGLKDVIGTILVAAIELAGNLIERALAGIVAAFSGLVDVVSGVVDLISALLSGDFTGAWNALVGIVDSVFKAIFDIAAGFVPELGNELQQVYLIAKAWLADGFNSIVGWFSGAIKSGVDYVAKTFPGVVAAAKAVYDGVKAWLVDAFGGIMSFVSGAVKWIVDQYGKVKKYLGLGEASSAPAAPQPAKPPAAAAPAPGPKRSVDFDDDDGPKKKGGGGGGKGRDTSHDQQNRDQLEFQVQLEAARLRGDVEAEAALRRKMDLSRQIEAYQRTGLSLAAATAAATRDMATLDAARRDGLAKDLERDETAHQIDLARISGNRTLEETLQRQQELKEKINGFLRDGLTLTEATARAARQQLETDQARAAVRARLLADDEQDRQMRLAQARGDSEERIRQLQREIDIRNRQRELEREFDMDPDSARKKAETEWSEEDKARQTGAFRETFKDGVRAALDGDLKGWIKNWWKDRVAKGMEEALNSLADLIASLFSKSGTAGGGGGIGGAIASIVGSIFGKKAAAKPGFATGGSFKVAGRSGIDQNLISFRATAGEMVNITRPGNDNGPAGGVSISMPITFSGAMDLATKTEAARFAEAARQAAIQGVMEAQRRRG